MTVKSKSNSGNRIHFLARRNGTRVLKALDFVATRLDSNPWILLSALFLLYAHVVIHQRIVPLWYDELYTYYIAQAPTFSQMIAWTRHIDLNPPLYYVAARFSIHLLHPSQFAVRLPSIVAYFVAALCAYCFVHRQLTPLYGSVAALILLGSSYSHYSYEARPYALVLGFLGITALGWQGATRDGRPNRYLSLILVLIGGFGMLLTHVLALVAFGAFYGAELVRFAIRRKTDWALWISLVLPLSACVLYLPLIQNHNAGVFAPVFQASIQALFDDYSSLWIDLTPFLALAMLLIGFTGIPPREKEQPTLAFNWPEITFCLWLILVPLIVVLRFIHSHSMFNPRYGIAAIFGIAILVPYLLACWTNRSRRAALIGASVFIASILHPSSLARILQTHLQPGSNNANLLRKSTTPFVYIRPGLPFVDADGITFLEMDHRENASFLSRVYYLSDPHAALQYAHSNVFNGLPYLKKEFPIRAHVEAYDQFVQQHPKFVMFGSSDYPDDWLMYKLLGDGATIRFLGEVPSSYNNSKIYEVEVHPKSGP